MDRILKLRDRGITLRVCDTREYFRDTDTISCIMIDGGRMLPSDQTRPLHLSREGSRSGTRQPSHSPCASSQDHQRSSAQSSSPWWKPRSLANQAPSSRGVPSQSAGLVSKADNPNHEIGSSRTGSNCKACHATKERRIKYTTQEARCVTGDCRCVQPGATSHKY